MNKKLLLGSLLVLTLLLLMPSIPAIQQKVIEDKAYSDLVEQLDFKGIRELIDSGKLDSIKHPLLYKLFLAVGLTQCVRALIVFFIMFFTCYKSDGLVIYIARPKLANIFNSRIDWFIYKSYLWGKFWLTISDKFNWNWR